MERNGEILFSNDLSNGGFLDFTPLRYVSLEMTGKILASYFWLLYSKKSYFCEKFQENGIFIRRFGFRADS